MIAGLFLFALGVVMFLRADLGLSPWDVLADGVRGNTPLTFGQAVILIGLLLVLGSLLAGIKPGAGTIANMILIGVFADLMLATDIGSTLDDQALWARVAVMLGGIVTTGLGSALYIGAELGAGPRDSLMIAVATRGHMRVGFARAIVEGTALLTGALLGGSIGVGTVVFALGIGPAVDLSFQLFRMDAAGRRRRVEPA
ncbi:MAG TPA: membrane protein [Actinomycetota bacterium]|nr:membrane protein [Actinomycetota bacterium]